MTCGGEAAGGDCREQTPIDLSTKFRFSAPAHLLLVGVDAGFEFCQLDLGVPVDGVGVRIAGAQILVLRR